MLGPGLLQGTDAIRRTGILMLTHIAALVLRAAWSRYPIEVPVISSRSPGTEPGLRAGHY